MTTGSRANVEGRKFSFPDDIAPYARTPTFSQRSIPKGLLAHHRTKAGTWAKIIVLEGRLVYTVLEPCVRQFELSPDQFGIVCPQVPHKVEAVEDVQFYVEFYR